VRRLLPVLLAVAAAGGAPAPAAAGDLPAEVRRLLESEDPRARGDGLKALRGRMDLVAARVAVAFLDDADPYCRDYAATVLLPRAKDAEAIDWIRDRAPRASTGPGRLAAADGLAAMEGGAGGPGLARLLSDRDPRVRTTALDGLARARPPEDPVAAARARGCAGDPDPGVRAAALDLRAAWGDPDAEEAAALALADASPLVRTAAAALAARRFPGLLGRSFAALAADADWGVRAAAARGAAVLAKAPPVPDLAGLLEDPRIRIRDLAHDSLRALSGLDLPPERADWLDWWSRTGGRGGGGAPARDPARASRTTWHGLPFRSDALLFVVDLSGSMEQPAGAVDARPRIEVATQELRRTLESLPDHARADVLAFLREPARALGRLQPLGGGVRARLGKWFERRPRGDRGDPGAALVAAILDGEADTILFLGDGAASAGDCLFHERIRERVRQALRLRPAVLHAVAFGSRPRDRAFLEDLATLSGGRFLER
jgi:hypothetical protein